MPKKVKSKKNTKNNSKKKDVRPLVLRDNEQEYATITKILAAKYYTCDCLDGAERLGIARKTMRRSRIAEHDIVLISLRDFEIGKCDIIHHYTSLEVGILRKLGELPPLQNDDNENIIEFEDEDNETKVDFENI